MRQHAGQQSLAIHRDVALAPMDLLGRVVTARAIAFRGSHALSVDDGSRRQQPLCELMDGITEPLPCPAWGQLQRAANTRS